MSIHIQCVVKKEELVEEGKIQPKEENEEEKFWIIIHEELEDIFYNKLKKPLTYKTHNETRWTSFYESLEMFIQNFSFITDF